MTPSLTLRDSLKAIEFYTKAFGAKKLGVLPSPDGKSTMHAAIKIGDSIIMMGDERPGQTCQSAESLGSSPVSLFLYVQDADKVYNQAIDAGGEVTMELDDMFWGDRCGTVKDPFGYSWTIATHVKDMTQEEMQEAADSFFAEMSRR